MDLLDVDIFGADAAWCIVAGYEMASERIQVANLRVRAHRLEVCEQAWSSLVSPQSEMWCCAWQYVPPYIHAESKDSSRSSRVARDNTRERPKLPNILLLIEVTFWAGSHFADKLMHLSWDIVCGVQKEFASNAWRLMFLNFLIATTHSKYGLVGETRG